MSSEHRQFVLLRHEQRGGGHWDFCLDVGAVLATWQTRDDPIVWMNRGDVTPLPMRRLADHRRAYLDYEGPISGDRGEVRRVDRGVYELIEQSDASWVVELKGERMAGQYRLAREQDDWTLYRLGR